MKKKLTGLSISNFALPFSAKKTSKIPKFRFLIAVVILGMLTCLSGCLNNATDNVPQDGSVTGKIADKTTGEALSGINVRLIDNTFKPVAESGSITAFGGYQAVNNTISKPYIAASVTTDSDGVYLMSNIADGDYSVVPGDISEMDAVSYELDRSTQSYSVILSGKSRAAVNFVRSNLDGTTSDMGPSYFKVNVTWQNIPGKEFTIVPYRRHMVVFVPAFDDKPIITEKNTARNNQTSSFSFHYGQTYLFYTLENVFLFRIEYHTGKWVDYNDGRGYQYEQKTIDTPAIFLPLSSTPANSSFVYDFATKYNRKSIYKLS